MNFLNLETNQRKNLALFFLFGASVVFTLYATAAFIFVKSVPGFVFWLGIVAHIQLFSLMAGFIAQLVKRRVSATKEGITITDEGVAYESEQSGYPNGRPSGIPERILENPA